MTATDSPPTDPTAASAFAALGLGDEIVAALTQLGYEEPTPIQREAIPTLLAGRDLLGQVAEAVHKYGKGLGVRVLAVYGGASMEQQLRALKRGVDVVIATPGRALDHIRRKTLALGALTVLVLDEADEML